MVTSVQIQLQQTNALKSRPRETCGSPVPARAQYQKAIRSLPVRTEPPRKKRPLRGISRGTRHAQVTRELRQGDLPFPGLFSQRAALWD